MSYVVRNVDVYSHQGFTRVNELNHYNEDRIYSGSTIFAVIDGATAIKPIDMNGINPSAYASQFLAQFFYGFEQTELNATELLVKANEALREDLTNNWPEVLGLGKLGPSAAVVVVKFHANDRISYANVSDCTIVVENQTGWEHLSYHNPIHAEIDIELGKVITQRHKETGLSFKEIRTHEDVFKMLTDNRMRINKDIGVFNYEEEMVDFIRGGYLTKDQIKHIALFSDGFIYPEEKGESDEALIKTAKLMKEKGVYASYEEIRELYDSDPDYERYSRIKHMDDITGLFLTL